MAGYGRSDNRNLLDNRDIDVWQHLTGEGYAGTLVMSHQIEEENGSSAGQAVNGNAA